METAHARMSDLTGNIREYIETRIDIVKLDAADTVATSASSMVAWLAIGIASLFTLFLFSTGAALAVGYMLENFVAGFFIVGGVYLLIALLLYACRDSWIRKPLINTIVKNIFDND
jgi:hypothetical protein